MARASEQLLIGVPFSDVAAGMRTDREISDDTLGGMLLGLRIKALRIETQQQHLVEPRAVAHGADLWVHRPAEGLLTVERQILGFQRLWGVAPTAKHHPRAAFRGSDRFAPRRCGG